MNEQLNAALVAIITKVTSAVDASVSFLQAELPDVIHQLLTWKFLQHSIEMFGPLLMAVAFVITALIFFKKELKDKNSYRNHPYCLKKKEISQLQSKWLRNSGEIASQAYREMKEAEKDLLGIRRPEIKESPYWYISVTCAGISICWAGIWILNLNFKWLQILVAPKMYLIEYAATLVK